MAEPTIFDKIIDGSIPSFKVWEDDGYVAFLTRWPNALGFTVVVPRENPGGNYLDVPEYAYTGILLAARKVAQGLAKAFDVERVGLVIEGEGVPHLHVKLIPMHANKDGDTPHATHTEFYPRYPGYLTTIEGPELTDASLQSIQEKIKKAMQ